MLAIDATIATELQQLLTRSGDYSGPISGSFDEATYQALERSGGRENLEERLLHDPADARIDLNVLDYLRANVGA